MEKFNPAQFLSPPQPLPLSHIYYGPENVDNQQTESNPFSVNEKKKRRRTTTVSLACNACRAKHVKCDAETPACGRCARKGETCVYEKTNKKRGPVAGQGKQGQSPFIEQAEQKIPIEKIPLQPVGVPLSDITTFYQTWSMPFFGISPPQISFIDFLNAEADPSNSALMYAILAYGARTMCHFERATEFLGHARNLVRDIYDQTNPPTAGTHLIMGQYYHMNGEIDKALCSFGLAQTMSKQLKKVVTRYPTVSNILISSTNGIVDFTPDRAEQVSLSTKMLEDALEFSDLSKQNQTLVYQTCTSFLSRIWTECIYLTSKGELVHPSRVREWSVLIKRAEALQGTLQNQVLKADLVPWILSVKATTMHHIGHKEISQHLVSEIIRFLSSLQQPVPTTPLQASLSVSLQILLYQQQNSEVLRMGIALMKQYAKVSKLAENFVNKILTPLDKGEAPQARPILDIHPPKGENSLQKMLSSLIVDQSILNEVLPPADILTSDLDAHEDVLGLENASGSPPLPTEL